MISNQHRARYEEHPFSTKLERLITELEASCGREMIPEQKLLLGHMGSVENLLATMYQEPVRIHVLSQRESNGTIKRSSILEGAVSCTAFVAAQSHISCSVLADNVLDKIRKQKIGIGSILTRHGLLYQRHIHTIGFDHVHKCPYREYAILVDDRKCIDIKEWVFPRKSGSRKTRDKMRFSESTSTIAKIDPR